MILSFLSYIVKSSFKYQNKTLKEMHLQFILRQFDACYQLLNILFLFFSTMTWHHTNYLRFQRKIELQVHQKSNHSLRKTPWKGSPGRPISFKWTIGLNLKPTSQPTNQQFPFYFGSQEFLKIVKKCTNQFCPLYEF